MPHQPYSRIADGGSTAVLFVHGIVGTPDQFADLLPLVPADWSIVSLLLPGHGGSVRDFSRASMAQWRQAVRGTVEKLAATHGRLLLVGHSMGTLFCIDEALRPDSKATGLFLLACPLYPRLTPSAAVQSLQVALGIRSKNPAYRAAIEACSVTATPKLWQYLGWIPRYLELFGAAKLGRAQIFEVSVPTTAVQSRHDELVSPRACKLLDAAPCTRLHILPASRHFYYSPEDLTLLKELFAGFLAQYQ